MERKGNKIVGIELSNIKNVEHGIASFYDDKNSLDKGALITGIYGQNGTGKTTLVNCLELLKTLALRESHFGKNESGNRFTNQFDYLLTLGKTKGFVKYEFIIFLNDDKYRIQYKLVLGKNKNYLKIESEEILASQIRDSGLKNYPELKYDFLNPVIENPYDGVKHRSIDSDLKPDISDIDKRISLESQLLSCIETGKSMIFSERNIDYLINSGEEKVALIGKLINELGKQISMNLFIYDKSKEALNQIGLGAVFGIYKNEKQEIHGIFRLSDQPFYVETDSLPLYEKAREEIELFISSFVSNFSLKMDKLATRIESDKEFTKIGFSRDCNGLSLPLSEESAGIRKLFSLCCALIYCYGNNNCWLVVDEFDSGVFENLLGQIMQVMEKEGRGQIIFTAHNLSPLERIDPKSIIFTTDNISNRFIRFPSIHPTNNLRSLYLRALRLGGTKEPLTSYVDLDSIDDALYSAYKLMR